MRQSRHTLRVERPKKPSGRNVHASERSTIVLQVRLSAELAAWARALCKAEGLLLADIVEKGCSVIDPEHTTR